MSIVADPSLRALIEALRDNPFYLAITVDCGSDEPRRRKLLEVYFAYAIAEAERIGRCVIGPAGAALWLLPIETAISEREAAAKAGFLRGLLGPLGHDIYQRAIGFMTPHAERVVPAGAWYLSILGVEPATQSRGIGAGLLAPTLAEADRKAATCFVETFTPRNVPFYERQGFHCVATAREPTIDADYVILVRAPRATAG